MSATSTAARAALAAALLLAAPATGLAQAKPRAATPSRTPAPTAPPPVAPKPAPAAVTPAPVEERGPWRLGGTLGWEWDTTPDSDLAGPRLQVELERDLVRLGARGQLSFVAAAAWWHATAEESLLGVKVEMKSDLLEVVPSFRASFAPAPLPRLRLFAELGAGGAWAQGEASTSYGGFSATVSDDAFAGVLRLAAGATWTINERLRAGVQLPTFHWRFGEEKSRSFALSAVAAYAL